MSTAKIHQWIEQLSARQKLSQWIENLSRSYDSSMDRRCDKICQKRSPRVLIDSYLSRICQEAVELDKKQFLKRKKNTQKWMQPSKLLNQDPNNILNFQKHHLTRKMQSIHDSKHTHTLNKSNQFYILKTSQDSLVSTHLHMYPLWWPNHIVLVQVSKVAKNMRVVCENIRRVHKCLKLWRFEIWENQF